MGFQLQNEKQEVTRGSALEQIDGSTCAESARGPAR
jgi:hypothetical protein